MKQRILLITLCLTLVCTTAFASILGDELFVDALDFGDGVVYNSNLFYSKQSGVGYQSEHYFTYTPNENVVPIITSGKTVYGRKTLPQMTSYLEEQGMTPIMGMNADFFSLETGIPIGHTITEGEILTKSEDGQDAIAFRKDGTAFLSWLEIKTELTTETQTIPIANINKYRLASKIYMMTDDYYSDTRANGWGVDVVIGSIEGKLAIGESVTGIVEDVDYHDGSVPIPEGKYVITLHADGDQDLYRQLESLQIGEEVTITNRAVNCPEGLWETAEYATGSVGGVLLRDGTMTGIDDTAAPRTAVGIKEDGSVVFYTIDGRQTGSYGIRLTTLAKRLLELGCVDAINMDGGGSTSVNGIYPGNSQSAILNSPSDGSLRSVSNFFALINTQPPQGDVGKLHLYPYGGIYLNGASQTFTVKATDSAGYAQTPPSDITYQIEGDAVYQGNHKVTFGTEDVYITVTSGAISSDRRLYRGVETPDSITIYNESTKKQISSLSVDSEAKVSLSASARYHHQALTSNDKCFTWSVSDNLGTIDEQGTFTAGEFAGSGTITVSAGKRTVSIPVTVIGPDDESPFMDLSMTEQDGIVTGTMIPTQGMNFDWISLTVDRLDMPIELSEDRQSFTCELPDEKFHKVTLKVGKGKKAAMLTTLEVGNPKTLVQPFRDMNGHWAKTSVNYLYHQGLISGFSELDGLYYRPSQMMTRAEFAVLLAKFKKISPVTASVGLADEGSLPTWAASSIKAVVKAGLMSGRPIDGTLVFDSSAPITRTEVCSVLSRALTEGYPKEVLTASDADEIPSWGLDAVRQMVALEIISGYEDKTLRPNNSVTRAEAAQMLYRLY
ncbi:MAG: hypothetical protein E7399_06405 [Ruminococcaceae bacterium]|nr:hypothetical protein [Oscillospiraceae bacterium]